MSFRTIFFAIKVLPVAQLHHQYRRRQRHGNGVGYDDGPCPQQQAVHQPQAHAQREGAVHAQRNAANVFGAKGVQRLGHKADGGECGGAVANEVGGEHGAWVFQRSFTAHSTSASTAGRAALALAWLTMAMSTYRLPLCACT
jgi:hypothetical protein